MWKPVARLVSGLLEVFADEPRTRLDVFKQKWLKARHPVARRRGLARFYHRVQVTVPSRPPSPVVPASSLPPL